MKRILEASGNAVEDNLSQSEWSDDDDEEGAASEPLLAGGDRESTGYMTDDPALENISMMNDAGLTDAEGKQPECLSGAHFYAH